MIKINEGNFVLLKLNVCDRMSPLFNFMALDLNNYGNNP